MAAVSSTQIQMCDLTHGKQKFLLGTLGLGSALVLGHVYSLYAGSFNTKSLIVTFFS